MVLHKPDVHFDMYWQRSVSDCEETVVEPEMHGEIYIEGDHIYLGRNKVWLKLPILNISKIYHIGTAKIVELCFGNYSLSIRSEDFEQIIALRDFLLLTIYQQGAGAALDLQYQPCIGGVS